MKSKKYLFGSIVTGVTLCAALVFNFVAFPNVLASTPEKPEIQTISTESIAPVANTTANETPDSNAVSKDQAIAGALKGLREFKYETDYSKYPCTVKYVKGTAPANEPLWVVIFTIKENYTMPKSEYLEGMKDKVDYAKKQGKDVSGFEDYEKNVDGIEGKDENGNAIIDFGEETHYLVVDVNALTGKYVDHGDYSVDNDPNGETKSILDEKYGLDFSLKK